jgi:hypothetical protein
MMPQPTTPIRSKAVLMALVQSFCVLIGQESPLIFDLKEVTSMNSNRSLIWDITLRAKV